MRSPVNQSSENTKRAWRIRAIAESRREAEMASRAPKAATTAALLRQANAEARAAMPVIVWVLAAGVVGAVLGVIVIAFLLGPRW